MNNSVTNSLTEEVFKMSTHFHLLIHPADCKYPLLGFQTSPKQAIIFKGEEITHEKLVVMLENATVPGEKLVNNLLVDIKALYSDILCGFSEDPDEERYDGGSSALYLVQDRLETIIKKYR